MQQQGVVPNKIASNAVISACEKGRYEQSLVVFQEMLLQGMVCNRSICNVLMQCLATASQIEAGLAVLAQVRASRLLPQVAEHCCSMICTHLQTYCTVRDAAILACSPLILSHMLSYTGVRARNGVCSSAVAACNFAIGVVLQ